MKKILSLLFSSVLFLNSNAQSFREIDQNNVTAGFGADGALFWNDTDFTSHLHSNDVNLSSAAARLWFGGYSGGGILHVAAETYRQTGTDFWPGPLDTTTVVCDSSRSDFYNKVWRMYCFEVDSFNTYLAGQASPGYVVPFDILDWPGNGDAAYGEGHYIGPYVDVDGDGFYNWSAGDYPKVKGQEALFYVTNDHLDGASHTESGGLPLGFEIHAMPYEFNLGWDEAVSNTVFVHYVIIDRSTIALDSLVIGMWSDLDLLPGNVGTRCGSDSTLSSYYVYNDHSAVGVVFLDDTMNGFIANNNDFTTMGNPQTTDDFYDYARQRWKDGSPLTYGGNGYGGNSPTRWMNSGDPASGSGWVSGNTIDQHNIGSTKPKFINPGSVFPFDVAFVMAHDTGSSYACVTKLKQYIADVRNFYATESQDCTPGVTGIEEAQNSNQLKLFPDPAQNMITISGMQEENYSIFNSLGQEILSGKLNPSGQVDISALAPGIYFIRTGEATTYQTVTFVKAE
ncbi:MAG TPA: T9SS type A sorting domain-containing protein [Bacteroidia bacterium]|jgi:hypothetical protein|nr:T9SS type A sorting domain-containing protein [Bacteroidia bacterium]